MKSQNDLSRSLLYKFYAKNIFWKRHANSLKKATDDEWWIYILKIEKFAFDFKMSLFTNSDISFQMKNDLWEQNLNFSRIYDEDIVHQICISILSDNATRRWKWFIKFSKSKQKYLLWLKMLSEKFVESLNALTSFAELWSVVQINIFSWLCNLHCFEIRDSFSTVFSFLNKW